MKSIRSLALSAALVALAAGCVTEPGPEDTTVYGHVSEPKKAKKQKRVKPQPIINEFPTGPVTGAPVAS